MIYTTYFANLKNLPEEIVPISISGSVPNFYKGIQYKRLAPRWETLTRYKQSGDEQAFIKDFYKYVLDGLDANRVVQDLLELSKGKDIALVCWEAPDKFCHRHLIAEWIFDKTGEHRVVEFNKEQYDNRDLI